MKIPSASFRPDPPGPQSSKKCNKLSVFANKTPNLGTTPLFLNDGVADRHFGPPLPPLPFLHLSWHVPVFLPVRRLVCSCCFVPFFLVSPLVSCRRVFLLVSSVVFSLIFPLVCSIVQHDAWTFHTPFRPAVLCHVLPSFSQLGKLPRKTTNIQNL